MKTLKCSLQIVLLQILLDQTDHIGGFNLGLVMRTLIGIGKPRRLQGLAALIFGLLYGLWGRIVAIRDCTALCWPQLLERRAANLAA